MCPLEFCHGNSITEMYENDESGFASPMKRLTACQLYYYYLHAYLSYSSR